MGFETLKSILNGKWHQPFSTRIFSLLNCIFFLKKKPCYLISAAASCCAQPLLMSRAVGAVKLWYSLLAVTPAEARRYSCIAPQWESTFSVDDGWDLLRLAPDSCFPAAPGAAAGPRTTSALPPGDTQCQALGSRRLEGASRHPCSDPLLKAGLAGVGCSHQGPCPVEFWNVPWAPLAVFDHPHSETFFFVSGGNFLCSRLCLLPSHPSVLQLWVCLCLLCTLPLITCRQQ